MRFNQHKILVFLLVIQFIFCGHIYHWETDVDYNYEGKAKQFTMNVKLENGLGPKDYFKVIWPFSLGSGGSCTASLYIFESNQRLGYQVLPTRESGQTYYFNFGEQIQKNEWLTFILETDDSVTAGIYNEPIEMYTTSDTTANEIIYDANPSMGTLFIADGLSTQNLGVSVAPLSDVTNENDPWATYFIDIDITPSITRQTGAYFVVEIIKDAGNSDGSAGPDFQFIGTCQSVHKGANNPVESNCKIDESLTKLVFEHQQGYTDTDGFTIRVKVKNPVYVSTRDIEVIALSRQNNRPLERNADRGCLEVTQITLSRGKYKYYWGISDDATTAGTVPLVPYKAESGGVLGPLNSIYIGFMTNKFIPMGSEFIVTIDIGATGVLESTFLTNLPTNNDGQVEFKFESGQIICTNVGALAYTNYEYFVAVKAFYSDSESDPSNYGEINITSIAYDQNQEVIPSVELFGTLAGKSITLQQNSEFLDDGSGGFHDTSAFYFGTTQVMSFFDDGTLSATPKAIEAILLDDDAARNKVGIFPRDSIDTDQQLLFFIKVPVASIGADDADLVSRMEVLFNSEVVKLREGFEDLGLDYAAWHPSGGLIATDIDEFKLDDFVCFIQDKCLQYDKPVDTVKNEILYQEETDDTKPFGIAYLECGVYDSTNNQPHTYCDNFQGSPYRVNDNATDSGLAGIFAIRHIYFDSDFHSSIYPDQKVMDFVIAFSQAQYTSELGAYSLQSATLINAYTLENVELSNIKVSYVNFYGHSTTVNDSQRVPLMLRIAGTVLQDEHKGATQIGVFVDKYMDSTSFYDDEDTLEDYSIGCSFGWCEYFGAQDVTEFQTESWMTSRTYIAGGLPNIENEFNLLIPVQNEANKQPESIVIAFFDEQQTSFGVRNQKRTLSVYRVFGPPLDGKLSTPKVKVNGLTDNAEASLDFTGDWTETGADSFNYNWDTTKIIPQGRQNTLLRSESTVLTQNAGLVEIGKRTMYGGSITISSIHYDIFPFAQVKFFEPPAEYEDCVKFSYTKNSGTAHLTGKKIHTVFCPMDSIFDLSSTAADIFIQNPQYPGNFVSGYPLEPVLSYAMSDNTGSILAFKIQNTEIPSNQNSCISEATRRAIHQQSVGKQKFEIPIIIPSDLSLDHAVLNGFPEIKISFEISVDLTMVTFDVAVCEVLSHSSDLVGCTIAANADPKIYEITLTAQAGQSVVILKDSEIVFGLYAGTEQGGDPFPDAVVTYDLNVYIPTQVSSANRLYGSDYNGSTDVLYCNTSSGIFLLSSQPLGTELSISSLQFQFQEMGSRGQQQFLFKSVSYRNLFYSTSEYLVDFGFLADENDDRFTEGDLRCMVYESDSEISWRWKEVDLSDLTAVSLVPKEDIDFPDQFDFIFKCEGGSVPIDDGGVEGDDLNIVWGDVWDGGNVNMQASTVNIDYPDTIDTTDKPFATAPVLVKEFATESFEAFYTFQLFSSAALNEFSRIYVQFSNGIPARFNRDGQPECYLREAGQESVESYCVFLGERLVQVWVNIDLDAGDQFFLDILGVAQPVSSKIVTDTTRVWIGIDTDDNIQNGLNEHGEIFDYPPVTTAMTELVIENIRVSDNKVSDTHKVSFEIDLAASVVVEDLLFYIDFSREVTDTITREQEMECYFESTITETDFVKSCKFISKRRLQVQLEADPLNDRPIKYQFQIVNLPTPSQIPEGPKNFVKFVVFFCDEDADYKPVSQIAYNYNAFYTSYEKDTTLIDLLWNFYYVYKNDIGYVDEEFIGSGEAEVFIGYYKRTLELKPEDSSKFQTNIEFEFLDDEKFQFSQSTYIAKTGEEYIRFNIAAQQDTDSGIYSLLSKKTGGDPLKEYSNIPPLKLIVRDRACQISAEDQKYFIPIGGQSIPIILDYFNCFPIEGITVTLDFSHSEVFIDENFENGNLTPDSVDSRIIFVVKSTTSISVDTTLQATFTISGPNSGSYIAPDPIELIFVDPTTGTYTIDPVGTSLAGSGDIDTELNTASMVIQCDQPSQIFWAIGVSPSVNNIDLATMEAKVTQNGKYLTRYEEPEDYDYWRIYGQQIASISLPVTLSFSGLKSNSLYQVKYFCKNQMSLVSNAIEGTWNVPNNGAYLLKITFSMGSKLKYSQVNDMACALSKVFSLEVERIFTEMSNICGEVSPIMGENIEVDDLLEKNLNEENQSYPYYYYIIPDYSLTKDATNLFIKEEISNKQFGNKVVEKLAVQENFPTFIEIETEDGDTDLIPVAVLDRVYRDYTDLTIQAHITDIKGYLYVAIIQGSFSTINQQLPPLTLLREGKYVDDDGETQNVSLKNIQVRFTAKDIVNDFYFGNLVIDTTYTVFIASSTDDPSHLSKNTDTQYFLFNTLAEEVLIYAGESRLQFGIYTLLLLAYFTIF